MIPLQEVHVLTPKTCYYTTLCGLWKFVSMINSTDFEMGRSAWIFWVNLI